MSFKNEIMLKPLFASYAMNHDSNKFNYYNYVFPQTSGQLYLHIWNNTSS
jgi:hypothetical protein